MIVAGVAAVGLAVVISLKKWLWDERTPSNVKCQQSQSVRPKGR